MGLRVDAIPDFVANLLPYFPDRKWVDISLTKQYYIASALMIKGKMEKMSDGRTIPVSRIEVDGGTDYSWRVRVSNAGNARNTALWEPDPQPGAEDHFKECSVGWRFQDVHWSWDRREKVWNKENHQIVDTLKGREVSCFMDMAELNEANLWQSPGDSASKAPYGIPYYIVKDTTTAGSFIGGAPSGFTDVAGLSPTDYSAWRNYAGGYTDVSAGDLVKKITKANYKCAFYAPTEVPSLVSDIRRAILTTFEVENALRVLCESRNDNLGWELIAGANRVTVGGVPVIKVPYLDENDTSDPVYGIDFESFKPIVHKGWDMLRTPRENDHNLHTVWYDNQNQYACVNRRSNWVFSK